MTAVGTREPSGESVGPPDPPSSAPPPLEQTADRRNAPSQPPALEPTADRRKAPSPLAALTRVHETEGRRTTRAAFADALVIGQEGSSDGPRGHPLPGVPGAPSAPQAVSPSGSEAGGGGNGAERPGSVAALSRGAAPSLVCTGTRRAAGGPVSPVDRPNDPASSPD